MTVKKAIDGEKFADLLAHIKYAIPAIFGHAILRLSADFWRGRSRCLRCLDGLSHLHQIGADGVDWGVYDCRRRIRLGQRENMGLFFNIPSEEVWG